MSACQAINYGRSYNFSLLLQVGGGFLNQHPPSRHGQGQAERQDDFTIKNCFVFPIMKAHLESKYKLEGLPFNSMSIELERRVSRTLLASMTIEDMAKMIEGGHSGVWSALTSSVGLCLHALVWEIQESRKMLPSF